MTNAWTPGPWVVHRDDENGWPLVAGATKDNGKRDIVAFGPIVMPLEIKEANARLIAAAPMGADLAECVLQNANDCPKAVIDRAVAFLAKAGGE